MQISRIFQAQTLIFSSGFPSSPIHKFLEFPLLSKISFLPFCCLKNINSVLIYSKKMATEILQPQDVLAGRFRVHAPSCARRRNLPAKCAAPAGLALNQNKNQQRRPAAKHEKKRSEVAAETKKPNRGGDRRRSSGGGSTLAMENVMLLRRGESLDSLATKIGGSSPRDPIRSDSELVAPLKVRRAAPPQPKVDVYAGAAIDSSPSPRCLPQPSFCSSKGVPSDDATRSLRRMLRLE